MKLNRKQLALVAIAWFLFGPVGGGYYLWLELFQRGFHGWELLTMANIAFSMFVFGVLCATLLRSWMDRLLDGD